MDEEQFQRKLTELMQEIGTLPSQDKDKLEALADETIRRHKEIKDGCNAIQESISYLRLCIKYLLFDLEATRRENQYLRTMLEQQEDDDD
jgi:hypothetical protein